MTRSQLQSAAYFWGVGCSTLQIAIRMGLPESAVYNALDDIKRHLWARQLEFDAAPNRAII